MPSHLDNVIREMAIGWRRRGMFIHAARKSGDPVRMERAEKAYRALIGDIIYETDPDILHRFILNLAMLQESELNPPDPRKKQRRNRPS